MLGLYVSDHPLFGMDRALAGLREMSVSALASDSRVDGQMVTIAGLITGLQRKVTKAKGEPWAIITLEDLEGSVDVLCFPALYAKVGILLAEDVVVVVKGRLEKGEDAPRVRAMDITAPNLVEPDQQGPIDVFMDANRATLPVIHRLREVLTEHAGSAPVHVHLRDGSRTTVMALDDSLRVTPSPALSGDLKALLGPRCLH